MPNCERGSPAARAGQRVTLRRAAQVPEPHKAYRRLGFAAPLAAARRLLDGQGCGHHAGLLEAGDVLGRCGVHAPSDGRRDLVLAEAAEIVTPFQRPSRVHIEAERHGELVGMG